jgi:hypothetical protein
MANNQYVAFYFYRCCKIDNNAFKTIDSSSDALPPAPASKPPSSSSFRETTDPSGVPHPGLATPVARAPCSFCTSNKGTSNNDCCARCLFCHSMGLRSRPGRTATELVAATKGLKCGVCRGFVCDTCLNVVIDKVKENRKSSLRHDPWCVEVQKYLESGTVPEKFVGHCCEWSIQKGAISKAATTAAEPRRYDGGLVLPEYGLVLDSPLNGDVDMHAFGNGDPQLEGVWHSLVPEATAIEAHKQDLVPDGADCSASESKIVSVTIPGLGVGDQQTVSLFLFPVCRIDF